MKYRTGRTHAYKSRICRSATFSERIPPPTGVVSGPLSETRKSRAASTVSFGSHCLNVLNAFSPAKTSNHATRRFPPYAFSTAASNTRRDAFQMSLPVPSPSINGIIGLSGTCSFPPSYPIAFPSPGTATPLYALFIIVPFLTCGTGTPACALRYSVTSSKQKNLRVPHPWFLRVGSYDLRSENRLSSLRFLVPTLNPMTLLRVLCGPSANSAVMSLSFPPTEPKTISHPLSHQKSPIPLPSSLI